MGGAGFCPSTVRVGIICICIFDTQDDTDSFIEIWQEFPAMLVFVGTLNTMNPWWILQTTHRMHNEGEESEM